MDSLAVTQALSWGKPWLDIVLLGLFLILFIIVFISLPDAEKRGSEFAKRRASEVAKETWYVDNRGPVEVVDGDHALGTVVRLTNNTNALILPVRPGHPDIGKFQELKKLDRIEFDLVSEGLDCALGNELCGYLRLKSVTPWTS